MKIGNMDIIVHKRTNPIDGLNAIYVRIIFLLIGLAIIGIFFLLIDVNPIDLYIDIIEINILLFPKTLARFITLLAIAVGLAIPFKARVDNIGAEGQYIMGTLAAFWIALMFPYLSPWVLIPLMFITGFIFGAIWTLPVVFFRSKGGFQGSDVVVSFLMVFPALYIMEFLVSGPWRDPETGFTYSSTIAENGQIPGIPISFKLPFQLNGKDILWNFSSVHITILLVLLLTILIYYLLFRKVKGVPVTKLGYEVNVIGKNSLAGKTAGMSFFKVVLYTMIISGGLAGIAGVGELAGNQLRLTPTSPGFGFTAIAVAYLGGLNPFGIILSSLFFSALIIGGNAIKLTQGLPGTALNLFSGMILIVVLITEFFFRYTFSIRSNRRGT